MISMAAQTLTDEVVAAAQEEAWHAEVDRQVAAFGPIGPERLAAIGRLLSPRCAEGRTALVPPARTA